MALGRGWILVAVAMMAVVGTDCLRFELAPAGTKCVSEEIHTNTLVLGDYHIVAADLPAGSSPKIHARVTSPFGTTLHFMENGDKGHFAFTTTEGGTYMACFWMHSSPSNVPVNVELDWKMGFDWANIAKREKLEGNLKVEANIDEVHWWRFLNSYKPGKILADIRLASKQILNFQLDRLHS